ncbi:UBX domain protein Ubx2 [Gnomoniopsis smithogilvyi]|uniref:UBX domain protein Ubx2 n=1 Tax=Gnomoniopsis smithogilvyi TaxID=1191159 RepID=A0A9W8Z210_9PEZI|nr:UBX domain protein Ubx2 [Gnomoniopsis smithogilvyi]
MDENVSQFMAITDQSADVARGCLEMTEGDVMAAVNMFFENPEIANSFNNPPPVAAATSSTIAGAAGASSRAQASSRSRPIGREDDAGVIHIDDDDDDEDIDDVLDDFDEDEEARNSNPANLQRIAQESDDAAMARRLQEEMYGGGGGASGGGLMDPDGVRAPIARTTETLVAPSGYGGYGIGDDGDDMEATMREMARRRARPAMRGNPFQQSIWADDDATPAGSGLAAPPTFANAASGVAGGQNSRAQRLAELFRPPFELMDNLDWEDARDTGKAEKKWILVNVQSMDDFNCQALNRDIWKDEAVIALVKENFLFLQYSKDDPRANEYSTFYFSRHAQENRDNFPHVAIIDPRTGEQVKVWSGIPFPSAQEFHAQLVEFLDRYSLDKSSKNPVVKQKAPQRTVDVDRMTEEEMLEMAMRNSLGEANGNGSGASSGANVLDPDALTKSVELDKGKGKEVAQDEVMDDAADSDENSIFAAIPSDRPHDEPAQGPNITRIQFRHPDGRIVRRFAVTDPVQRIYEWLKVEKPGISFELKTMPAGRDLLEDLDKSIEQAELKQATVLIEYVE